jgi:proteasome accessory factor B
LYLVAHSVDHGEVRLFKLDRLEAVERLELRFTSPTNFDLREYFSDAFGVFRGQGRPRRVRIRFLPKVARYVEEKKWHQSQKLKREKDGSLIAEFQLSSTDEIRKWVLGFGRNAVVLEPREMREKIREDLRALLGLYEEEVRPQRRPKPN